MYLGLACFPHALGLSPAAVQVWPANPARQGQQPLMGIISLSLSLFKLARAELPLVVLLNLEKRNERKIEFTLQTHIPIHCSVSLCCPQPQAPALPWGCSLGMLKP